MQFREEKTVTKVQKQTYLDGLNALIRARQRQAKSDRDLYIQNIFSDADRYRNDLREMLGWPLNTHFEGLPRVQSTRLGEESGYIITRMQFEILDGVWLGGLLFQKGEQKKPLVIVSHGGLGTPELISGFYDGNTENYNGILDRVLQYDVHVFAPQWLLWHSDYEVPFDRARIDGALKSVGSSITAVELHGLFRILDWLEAQSYVDWGSPMAASTPCLRPRLRYAFTLPSPAPSLTIVMRYTGQTGCGKRQPVASTMPKSPPFAIRATCALRSEQGMSCLNAAMHSVPLTACVPLPRHRAWGPTGSILSCLMATTNFAAMISPLNVWFAT